MRSFCEQMWSVLVKDLRQWRRDPQAAIGPMLMPLVMMFLTSILFGFGGDDWAVGLIVEGRGPAAGRLATAIEQARGQISPYFRIVTRDEKEAQRLAAAGRLHMVIAIPADFDDRMAAGQPAVVRTQVYNLNTDITKNVRLRLQHAIQDYLSAGGRAPVTVAQFTSLPADIWRREFIAGGAVILTLLVGATLNTAIMVAREWERRTVKVLYLAPHPVAAITAGKLAAGLVTTGINVAVSLIAAVGVFGLRIPSERWLPLLGTGLLAATAAAGLGLGLGAWLKQYRTLQPLIAVTAAGSFFAAGGWATIATMPPGVRLFARVWPPAYVFETMHDLMHRPALSDVSGAWLGFGAAAVLGVAFGGTVMRRIFTGAAAGFGARH
ncbi:MAG TPA: ABC transporter permease [Symbiobacteriaceae bacterium]|nr:ABC transporter permease [Symbiobacteriaceae bacterium]